MTTARVKGVQLVGKPPTNTIAAAILAQRQSLPHPTTLSRYAYGLMVHYVGQHGKTNQTLPSENFLHNMTYNMIKQYLFPHRAHLQRTAPP